MNFKYVKYSLLLLLAFASGISQAQELSLDSLMQQMITNNPNVLKAQQLLKQSNEQLEIIKSNYRPNIGGDARYMYVHPVSEAALGGENVIFNPENNFDIAVNVDQTIYDFGSSSKAKAVEQAHQGLINLSISELQETLSLQLINTYYQIVYLQRALDINQEEISNLEEHKSIVEKKLKSGTSTRYELLSTDVRISKLRNARVDFERMRVKQLAVLSVLISKELSNDTRIPDSLPELLVGKDGEAAFDQAYAHRNQILIAQSKEDMANLQYDAIRTEMNPRLSALGAVGVQNGFFPDITEMRFKYSIGASLSVPIYNGSKNRHERMLQQAKQAELSYESQATKENIRKEVLQAMEDLNAAEHKIPQNELQLEQSEEAYRLAQISFESGSITNLDLLDASTNVEDSKLNLLQSKIQYLLSIYNYKHSMGEQLYK